MTPELENKILEAQNKKLLADIRVMACCTGWEAIQMRMKWRKVFENEAELDNRIAEALKIKN